jgi:hypothetical protein
MRVPRGITSIVIWGWLSLLSLLGTFVTVRQIIVIERQKAVLQQDALQDAQVKSIYEHMRGLDARISKLESR